MDVIPLVGLPEDVEISFDRSEPMELKNFSPKTNRNEIVNNSPLENKQGTQYTYKVIRNDIYIEKSIQINGKYIYLLHINVIERIGNHWFWFKNTNVKLKWVNNSSAKIANQYLDQNKKIKKQKFILDLIQKNKSEIILFGENDYPFLMNLNNINLIQNHIQNNQSVIIGSTRKEDNNYFNSIFLIRKNEYSYFDKQILVPFGEFVPLRNLFSFIEFISGSFDFTEGAIERNLYLDNIKILPIICYEILFFWKLLDESNINSDIIVNITNDSWFGDYSGPYQHFYFAKLRAAEFNKTLIRVSANGISAGIDNFGRVIKFIELNQQQNKIISIPINRSNNQYIRLHKIIFFLIFFPLLIIFFTNKKNV